MNVKTQEPPLHTKQRIRVIAMNGAELSPASPKTIRKMLETGAAYIKDVAGVKVAQMKREVGGVVPHS